MQKNFDNAIAIGEKGLMVAKNLSSEKFPLDPENYLSILTNTLSAYHQAKKNKTRALEIVEEGLQVSRKFFDENNIYFKSFTSAKKELKKLKLKLKTKNKNKEDIRLPKLIVVEQ
jgi:hypothetical protein